MLVPARNRVQVYGNALVRPLGTEIRTPNVST